jgi:PAS domain S-box-containing protein
MADVRRRVKRMRRLTVRGCILGGAKLLMIEAELARVAGRARRAEERYEGAVAHARKLAHVNDEALAYELAGRHALASGKDDYATVMLRNAHNAYLRWGAYAKAEHMERIYDIYLHDASRGPGAGSRHELAGSRHELAGSRHEHLDTAGLDANAVIRATQTLSSEVVTDRVLDNLLKLAIEQAGAQKACLLMSDRDGLAVHAMTLAEPFETKLMRPPTRLEECRDLPGSVIYYVSRTREVLCLGNARAEELFHHDPYITDNAILSVLVVPLLNWNELKGILYLEHAELPEVFTPQRIEVIRVLATQAAISLENAQLYTRLGDARDEYRALWESAIEGLFKMAPPGGLVRANPAFASILGFTNVTDVLSEYADLPSRLFASGNDARAFMSKIEHGVNVQSFEAPCIRADGSSIWLSITAQLRYDIEGRATHVDASLMDISERKAREQAEKERNVAEASAKAKSDFLAHMSHEIRTPMNAIVGFTRLALEGELSEEHRNYLDSIDGASRTLLAIINDILDFSKIEAGKLVLENVPLRIDALLQELEVMFEHIAQEKVIELRFQDETAVALPAHGYVRGDPLRLKQVLTNLISNALKFTSEGRVVVSAGIDASGDSIEFAVVDSGIGITPDILERLFEPFEQAESSISRRYGGTGLGLSICRHLVALMDGNIDVESTPGSGSRFHFRLPLDVPSEAEVSAAIDKRTRHARTDQPLAGTSILLAEDNPVNQKLAKHFLERGGARVSTADTGRAAVELSTQQRFDAILMDLHMPEMDGLEACRAIRGRGDRTPIIAVSADAMTRNLDSTAAAGFDEYLLKPIDYDTLLETLTHAIRDARMQDSAGVIDLRKALKYHAGDARLLERLFIEFVRHYHDADQRMAQLIAGGNFAGAERLAHNLVGVGGGFGAQVLADRAAALEAALENRETDELEALQQDLQHALTDVLDEARQFTP